MLTGSFSAGNPQLFAGSESLDESKLSTAAVLGDMLLIELVAGALTMDAVRTLVLIGAVESELATEVVMVG